MPTLISPKSLNELMEQGQPVHVLDVRTPAEHAEIHIEGSQLMPLDRLDPGSIRGNGPCVLVCRSGKRAEQACQKLTTAGCENLAILEGGVLAWEQAGLPVTRGQKTLSLERQVRITAGLFVLAGVILGTWLHPALYGLSAFVGAGLTFAGITDWCGMAMLLAKAPWNQRNGAQSASKSCSA